MTAEDVTSFRFTGPFIQISSQLFSGFMNYSKQTAFCLCVAPLTTVYAISDAQLPFLLFVSVM